MAYTDKTTIEQSLGVTIDNTLSTFVSLLISAVTEFIEVTAGNGQVERRKFENADSNTTRYYNGNGLSKLPVDDLRSIATLSVDGVELVENTDYYLYPLNETVKTHICLIQPSTNRNPRARANYIFEEDVRNVIVTGKFGYSVTVPDLIKVIATQLAGSIFKGRIGDSNLQTVTSESLGEYSVSYSDVSKSAKELGVEAMMTPYLRKPMKTPMSGVIQAS